MAELKTLGLFLRCQGGQPQRTGRPQDKAWPVFR